MILILSLIGACTTSPHLRENETVSMRILEPADFDLDIVNEADPGTRPGALAGQNAGEAFHECASDDAILLKLISPFCAAVGAAVGAATGAAVSGATTLPDDDAALLREASARVMGSRDWQKTYLASLEQTARARDIVVNSGNVDTRISVYLQTLEWDIIIGNQAQIVADVQVLIQQDQNRFIKSYRKSSAAFQADKWAEGDGQAVADALEQLFIDTSNEFWADFAGDRTSR